MALVEGRCFKKDCFLWVPTWPDTRRIGAYYPFIQEWAIRASYYTSVRGDDDTLKAVRNSLRDLYFSPYVFKQSQKGTKARGVDIALARDLLGHAFSGNYQSVVLVAGDGAYLPLVDEVKRLGKRVIVWFFGGEGLSPQLKLACDEFLDLKDQFLDNWRRNPSAGLPR